MSALRSLSPLAPLAPLAVLALLAATPVRSQDLSGTYAISGSGTTVTLTLRQGRNGQITGTLRGNTTFQVQAQAEGAGFAGFASNQSGRIYLEGRLAGSQLAVAMAEVDASGQPQPQTARQVVMSRVERGAGGAVAGTGTADRASPRKGERGAAGAAAGGSPQDRQIAQLLLRSAWCSFSYSAVPGTQSSGSSHTERVVFRADGTGNRQTGGESYSSGENGWVGGHSAGGEPFRWQVRSGLLLTSADGVNWGRTVLQISQNSNGYPIVTADGKEYSMCN